jgi:hypothetical protein
MRPALWIPLSTGMFLFGIAVPNDVCREALKKWGIALPSCPDGTPRQTADMSAKGLRRGATGKLFFGATAHYTTDGADDVKRAPIKGADVEVTLIDSKGGKKPLAVDWKKAGDGLTAELALATDLPDGDYKLHAKYTTKLGPGELEVPVPLYTPARIHVITDRPLYEPGNVVKFRAVVLRARDLAPIDGRPGKWQVKDPSGEVMLEEKAPAGEWGVVAGSFPLDKGAPTGSWRVSWVSNDAIDEVPFTVEPFTLPRFRVEAASDKPFFGAGDTPTIKGSVVYSSGAPVVGAKLDIQWQIAGTWPPPLDWEAKLLPKHAVTTGNGRFELALPKIPDDLQGKATMTARISAVDPAGDRVEGQTSVLLSRDGIQASAVTELGNGLVENFNNRLYVRVATADGRVVSKAKVKLKRTWQENDNGIDAELDEDGVASVQIDPGAPVNIVIPAVPWRPEPKVALVTRGEATEMIGSEGSPLADQVEMDKWLPALAPCAKWYGDNPAVTVGLRVASSGTIITAASGATAMESCVANVLRGKRLPAGHERLYRVAFSFTDPELPTLSASVEGVIGEPEGLEGEIGEKAKSARDCLPNVEGELPSFVTWRARAKSKEVELGGWARDPNVEGAGASAAMACVQARMGTRVTLADEAESDAVGVIRFSVALPESVQDSKPQPTTMIGYELDVIADVDGKPATTKLRIEPGQVPNLRMRVTPVVAKPGETITAQLIRGPAFTGKLPKELRIDCLKWKQEKLELDEERKTTVTIDPSVEGWCEVTGGGQRSLVYVRPQAELAVTVSPKEKTYRPGQRAELVIQTLLGGKGGKAAVGLFGVDESLGQLVPLPGPDSMGRVRPKVETSSPAFGVLDGQALALGRIRGANAAAATVLRVSSIPKPPELDAMVDARASSKFDPVEELTDRFYIVLAELHAQARQWEAKSPPAEKMQPPAMARLWSQALDAVAARGESITDAYGRRLTLSRLPSDLLALTDPRAVIVVGTRLPEDVENWAQWVAKEKP